MTPSDRALPDHCAFTPVPMARRRADGWTPLKQRRFIVALDAMGAVGPAARAVGMSRASAYRLRERPGAESFAAAWDRAIEAGQARMWDAAMERAIDGVTTIRVHKGGSVSLTGGPDMRLIHDALAKRGPLARQRRQI